MNFLRKYLTRILLSINEVLIDLYYLPPMILHTFVHAFSSELDRAQLFVVELL